MLHKIWDARNLQLYQQKRLNPIRVAEEALERVMEFKNWNPKERIKEKDSAWLSPVQGISIL